MAESPERIKLCEAEMTTDPRLQCLGDSHFFVVPPDTCKDMRWKDNREGLSEYNASVV